MVGRDTLGAEEAEAEAETALEVLLDNQVAAAEDDRVAVRLEAVDLLLAE